MFQPNFQVKLQQSDVEEFDAEVFDSPPPPPSSNPSVVVDDGNDANMDLATTAEETDDDDAALNRGGTSLSGCSKKISLFSAAAVFMVLGTTAVIGGAVAGSFKHKEQLQQQANAAIIGGSSKSGKSAPFCESAYAVPSCGEVFTNEKVVLNEDLFCTDEVTSTAPQDWKKKQYNAAIKLDGPDAVIDCKGFTVRQESQDNSFGYSAVNCAQTPTTFGNTGANLILKEGCGLYYIAGIWLKNGAKAINCNVEQFYDGFAIEDGGEVKKSEAARNNRGITIRDRSSSGSSKISDVYVHDNGDGLVARDIPPNNGNSVIIEDLISKRNKKFGIQIRDTDVTVKDSTLSYNGQVGIVISGDVASNPTKVQLEGVVSAHHNGSQGIRLREGNGFGEIIVKGDLNSFLNSADGINIDQQYDDVDMTFTVEKSGSFKACGNIGPDILSAANNPGVDFVDMGTGGYVCSSTEDENGEPFDLCEDSCPVCIP